MTYIKAETPFEWHNEILQVCKKYWHNNSSTPLMKEIDLLAKLDASAYKIASFELCDLPLIKYVARKQNKPTIMSHNLEFQLKKR